MKFLFLQKETVSVCLTSNRAVCQIVVAVIACQNCLYVCKFKHQMVTCIMYYLSPGVLPDILSLCVALSFATRLPVVCGSCVQSNSSRLLGRSAPHHARRTAWPRCHCKLSTLVSKWNQTGLSNDVNLLDIWLMLE